MIYCDNNRCEHNNNKTCILKDPYIVDDYCVSRRKRNDTDNYKQLMQAPFKDGCHRQSSKWKNNTGDILK